ncbi:MAG: hypothetical protein Q8P53_01120 [Candidatus Shapirobacteria bacterium]|nr:hypothetical protein [Candidatus Shapirobacteria bacterium]
MKDNCRNSRTLIVSFVVALMVLVPLRFVAESNDLTDYSNSSVLGVTILNPVVLPNADLEDSSVNCMEVEQVDLKIDALTNKYLDSISLTMGEEKEILAEIDQLENSKCQ